MSRYVTKKFEKKIQAFHRAAVDLIEAAAEDKDELSGHVSATFVSDYHPFDGDGKIQLADYRGVIVTLPVLMVETR